MSFASPAFLVLLAVTMLVGLFLPRGWPIRYWIVFVSLVYFGVSGIRDLCIFLLVKIPCYFFGILAERLKSRIALAIFVTTLFTPLFLVKYYSFFVSLLPQLDILSSTSPVAGFFLSGLPVGISFYSFQAVAYVIDVQRGVFPAAKSPTKFALFIVYFPQLIAGPIERAAHLIPQLDQLEKDGFSGEKVNYALALIAMGLILKATIADNLAPFVDQFYANAAARPDLDAVRAIYYFSLQIYGDFYGYTLIALGSAHLMGIDLIHNFDHPYFSTNIQNFWRRWHISLTNWFRDYVYIPLGGNRVSRVRNAFNLILILLLVGLWHGANWTFVVWGFTHGMALAVHRTYVSLARRHSLLTRFHERGAAKLLCFLLTFHFVAAAWVFFRSPNLRTAYLVLAKATHSFASLEIFRSVGGQRPSFESAVFLLGILFLVLDYFLKPAQWFDRSALISRLFVAAVASLFFYLASPNAVRFIYFQF